MLCKCNKNNCRKHDISSIPTSVTAPTVAPADEDTAPVAVVALPAGMIAGALPSTPATVANASSLPPPHSNLTAILDTDCLATKTATRTTKTRDAKFLLTNRARALLRKPSLKPPPEEKPADSCSNRDRRENKSNKRMAQESEDKTVAKREKERSEKERERENQGGNKEGRSRKEENRDNRRRRRQPVQRQNAGPACAPSLQNCTPLVRNRPKASRHRMASNDLYERTRSAVLGGVGVTDRALFEF